MNTKSVSPSQPATSQGPSSPRKRSAAARRPHAAQGGSREANRIGVAILEVLAGVRTPAEAAAALQISLPRYYVLEKRALEGMVAACEAKPMGKQPSQETRITALEKQLQQAHRECARHQALVRAAQRSIGLAIPSAQQSKTTPRDRKGRKKRRPAVRALKAARALDDRIALREAPEVQPGEESPPPTEPTQPALAEDPRVGSC